MAECKHDSKEYASGPEFPYSNEGDVYTGQIGVFRIRCYKCDTVLSAVAGQAYPARFVGRGSFSERHGDFVFKGASAQQVLG